MASRKFNVYRFIYTADNGDSFIREQRITINNNTNIEDFPVTSLFLAKVVSLPEDQKKIKAEKFRNNERKTEVIYDDKLNNGIANRYIPYETNEMIRRFLLEISEQQSFICQTYIGESRNYDVNSISI